MVKNIYSILGVLILVAAFLVGCQPKEITSAKVYKQQNDWDNAIVQLEKAVQTYPANAEAHYLLGEAYGEKKRWAEMSKEFGESLKINSAHENDIKYYRDKYWVENFNKGVELFNKDDMEGSVSSLNTAVTIDPARPESYRNLAVAYVRLDKMDEAIDAYKNAINVDPKHVETINNMGLTYFQMNKFEDAIETFKKVLEIDPSNEKAISTIAFSYDRLGQTDKAIAAYENALKSEPDNADLLFNYARLFYQKEDYNKAISILEKVVENNPDDYESLLSVGDSYLRIAESFKNDANKLDADGGSTAKIDELRGLAKESYEKAIKYLERAVSIKDDVSTIWHNLGVAYINAGRVEDGTKAFEKAEALKKQ
ncbi:MAG: tetratricopeptide repeat protein [Deferribacteres bacterium]|nr:tetratricopeptide repeat protein [candidate division KSB1 bacterium]MCB9502856.1 tetratricopeptide repeat protein [Deferribacteres bacterium]